MRVLLVNPPWEKPGHYYVRAGSRWPHFERAGTRYMPFPFFMAYAAALLEQSGFAPAVVDACAERLTATAFLARVESARPDLVLMETSTPSFANDREVLQQMRRRVPDGGRFAVAGAWQDPDGRSYLSQVPEADFFLPGEYEETLLELAQALADGRPTRTIPSLELRDGTNVLRTPARPLRADLDTLPHPARHLFDMHRYEDLSGCLPAPSLQLWGSRGCPYGCVFCVWPQIMYRSRTYRARRPARIVDEIVAERARFPYRSFYFDDDTFNIGKERMLELAAELQRRQVGLPWGMMARADTSDEETLARLREAGLEAAKFGLESADQALVDGARKSLDLAVAFRHIRFARSLGIKVHLTFTFGLPGETKETIKKTVDTALELDPVSVQFSILTPFPGCDLFQTLRREDRLTSLDFTRYDGYTSAVFRSDTLSAATLEKACAYAERRWRRHQLRRLVFGGPAGLWQKALANPGKAVDILLGLLHLR
ncbi:MAG: radical SAM protein [Candidatus Riflebacteria bacterium]|nr:radical SAM protein [Candidatus Riflebacteria bacterium]